GAAVTRAVLDVGKFYAAPVIGDWMFRINPEAFIPPAQAVIARDPFSPDAGRVVQPLNRIAGSTASVLANEPTAAMPSKERPSFEFDAGRSGPTAKQSDQNSRGLSTQRQASLPASNTGGNAVRSSPGGISFTKAAAESLPLNISLDAIYV